MNIYFAASIRGGRADVHIYLELIEFLKTFGTVLTEHIGNNALVESGELNLSDKVVHDRDMNWLLSADVVVAEVTTPSLGVGYEIGRALEHGKRILCLYRPADRPHLSAMIAGSEGVNVRAYSTLDDAKKLIEEFIGEHEQ